MRRLRVLAWRELRGQFLSPVSWGLLTLVWFIYGAFYTWSIIPNSGGDIPNMTWSGSLLAMTLQLFLVPLQTMRLISEEKRIGTFEMLVTTPARDHEIVVAKFLGAFVFNAAIWLVMPAYALVIRLSGGNPDFGPVWTSYSAIVAVGALYVAVGLFASAMTRHQIMAAFLAVVLLILIGVVPNFWDRIPEDFGWLRNVLRAGDLMAQTDQAAYGLLDLVHLTYKLVFCGLFLLFTTRILEARKWA